MTKEKINYDILIIGAGLTGLTINYLLKDSPLSVGIIEARNRIGGRIQTEVIGSGAIVELGATWLGKKHQYLFNLLSDLDINTFEQVIGSTAIYEAISTSPFYLAQLPSNPDPSYRIVGGTSSIIKALGSHVLPKNLHLNTKVTKVQDSELSVIIESQSHQFSAQKVISTLPPNLLVNTIDFGNNLNDNFINLARNTHTWMAESIKIALTYKEPFWRSENLSGTIMSNVGPISEMYDHTNIEDNRYALMGFLNGSYFQLSKSERLDIIMNQLQKYYGSKASEYIDYEEKVWRNDEYSYAPYTSNVLPHQMNGHEAYQRSYMNDRLIIAGTETSSSYPGYMEGAVYSALSTVQKINKGMQSN